MYHFCKALMCIYFLFFERKGKWVTSVGVKVKEGPPLKARKGRKGIFKALLIFPF